MQYKLQNTTNGSLYPDDAFGRLASITDGKATWKATTDYQASSIVDSLTGTPSSASDDIGAGFDTTTWAIFDVPMSVAPVGVVLAYESNSPVVLQLPAASS